MVQVHSKKRYEVRSTQNEKEEKEGSLPLTSPLITMVQLYLNRGF